MEKYYATFNYLEFELPIEAVNDCSHQGECYHDCQHWQKELNLNLDRESMIKELSEYGAWSGDELNGLDDAELEIKLIWIGAGNIQDEKAV